jgi:hypothetical protein
MQGLTSLSISDSSINTEELTDNDLCPFLSQTKASFFQEPMDEVIWRVIKCHLRCMRASESEHAALETKGWVLFHVTFYEILQSQVENQLSELWPCGELHSDRYRQGRPRKIRESTLTVCRPSLVITHAEEYSRLLQRQLQRFLVQIRDLFTGRYSACALTTFLIYRTPRAEMTCPANEPTK